MSLHILEDRASIRAAIATMHPVARDAAQLLAHRIFENPVVVHDDSKLQEEWAQACAISFARAGKNPAVFQDEFATFVENHGSAVMNVGVSIVVHLTKSSQRKRWLGWIGKAAAVGGGIAIGAFFG